MINESSISLSKNQMARANLNQSVLEKRNDSRVNNTVAFEEKNNPNSRNKTTDDLMNQQQLSKSLGGPTHYTSNISQKQMLNNSQIEGSKNVLPNINLSRQ